MNNQTLCTKKLFILDSWRQAFKAEFFNKLQKSQNTYLNKISVKFKFTDIFIHMYLKRNSMIFTFSNVNATKLFKFKSKYQYICHTATI